MTVALCIEPYEFSENFGPDDLSDVDLTHPNFLAAFPLGVVPIKHVPQPRCGHGDGFFSWAENVLAMHDALEGLDVDEIMHAVDQIQNYELVGGDRDITLIKWSIQDRKALFLPLLRAGLSLRVITRLLSWSDRAVVEALFSPDTAKYATELVAADEMVLDGMTCRGAARALGIGYQSVRRVQVMRKPLALVTERDTARAENG